MDKQLDRIVGKDSNQGYPLSFGQRRLWLVNQIEPENTSYNLINATRIKGYINVSILGKSINEIIKRHESLRTVFKAVKGAPFQYILPKLRIDLELINFENKAAAHREIDFKEILSRESTFSFNLEKGPLLRVILIKTGNDEYIFILNIHHIIADGWSLNLFMNEVIEFYFTALERRRPVLKPLAVTFSEYSLQQVDNYENGLFENDLKFWCEQLQNAPSCLDLPADFQRTETSDGKGSSLNFEIDTAMTNSLIELARKKKTTLFMILLSCLEVLLHRYTGENDILVGVPVSGRSRLETEAMIGYFSNTLVVRAGIQEEQTFTELLKRVAETMLNAYEHQDMPFEKIVEILKPERVPGYSPLFQVFFSFQDRGNNVKEINGISFEHLILKRETSKFDLSFEITKYEERLVLDIEYRNSLFSAQTIERFFQHYLRIIESVISNPEVLLSKIDLLSKTEKNQILIDWNNTRTPYPEEKCVHHLFEEQAEKTGSQIAVRDEQNSLSCRDLNIEANKLAQYLQTSGVNPGDRIGLFLDEGLPLVISILGIWKRGCGYVPIDPDFPENRIKSIIADSGLRWMLIPSDGKNPVSVNGVKALPFSAYQGESSSISKADAKPVSSDSLAYLIYTSGSTGAPKGVLVSHKSVVNALTSFQKMFEITRNDVFISVTKFTFDISILEIFLPLLSGASLILLSRHAKQDVETLKRDFDIIKPTIIQATPSMWRMLIDAGWQGDKRGLRILCGGEVLDRKLAEELIIRGREVWNMYGPTETTIWSLVHKVSSGKRDVPIGKPIANTYVYILDKFLSPVPPGVTGDIYIGGDGLALGYNNQIVKTQTKFMENRWGKPGRVYFTGDKGKYDKYGIVHFVGRDDYQLKIRGFRVEAGEIEKQMLGFRGIDGCVVTSVRDETGENKLVAYITCKNNGDTVFDEDRLYDYLAKYLPTYMIPSFVISLDSFPLTSSNKVDRKRLPAPAEKHRYGRNAFEAPHNDEQAKMVEIWKETLQMASISIQDNFFHVGGHSLLAVKMISKINEEYQTDIGLKDLFQQPVLSSLCEIIKKRRKQDGGARMVSSGYTIKSNFQERNEPFEMTDIQTAYWLGKHSSLGLGKVATHIYQELELTTLDTVRFNDVLNQMIERHDMLRAIIQPDGKQVILKEVPPYNIRVEKLEGSDIKNDEKKLEDIRDEMSHQVLPSDRWPLFDIRATVFKNGNVRLHISFDLLIADAWSFRILLNEIAILYENPEAALPPIDISFRDYVLAVKELEKTEVYKRASEFWLKKLDSIPTGPALPLMLEPDSISKPVFKRVKTVLEPSQWERLKNQARKFHITPNGLLLTAFSEVLAKWSKGDPFTLNITTFNRLPLHEEINNIIGDFTSVVLLEVTELYQNDFKWRAKCIQERLWDNMDHRYFSGTRVMSQLIRKGHLQHIMPVIFTSHLGFENTLKVVTKPFIKTDLADGNYGISQTPQIWLDHQVTEIDGTLEANWDFVEGIFPKGMIESMFDTYCQLLAKLGSEDTWNQSRPLKFYDDQMQQSLNKLYEVQEVPPELLHTLFIKQVKKNPEHIAVISGEHKLTYAELDKMSDSVAYNLDTIFNQKNAIIAIFMEKGWEQIAAALGILKSQNTYLPIDPDLPEERIRLLLEKGEVGVVLTQEKYRTKITAQDNLKVFIVNDTLKNWEGRYQTNPEQDPRCPAYVIFTSGSTGQPKGVVIDHQGAVNTIIDINSRFNINASDSVLAISSLSFDLSVYDIFGILGAGGTIILPEAKKVRDPEHWLQLMDNYGVTLWDSVPALMSMLMKNGNQDMNKALSHLRLVLLSGDWIPMHLPDEVKHINPDVEVISLGGATEASIWSIYFPIKTIDPQWKSIPYGWPLKNQRVHVLDKRMALCPTWVPGELYIGGLGVAQGYLNDKEKTEHSFVTYPDKAERVYRTGDLGRYKPDGSIEFLGREDTQVKVQGFRIELGEIESVIKGNPLVKDVVVAAIGDKLEDKKLHAFIIPSHESGIAAGSSNLKDELILDPSERLDFKVKEVAIRRDLTGECIDLGDTGLTKRDSFIKRRSYRKYINTVIPFEHFASLISHLAQINLEGIPFPKYQYASSGGLYPIQVYCYVREGRISGIPGGIYYYNPKSKKLFLVSKADINNEIHVPDNQPIFEESAFSIFLIADKNAISPMYGEETGEKYCYMEAGAISQLLEMNALKYDIGLCQIGAIDFDSLRPFLKLSDGCVYLHCLVGGYISREQQTTDGIADEWQKYQQSKMKYKKRGSVTQYTDQLREEIIKKLPYYMVPVSFHIIKEFPLTPNGKVDRKALGTSENRAKIQRAGDTNQVGDIIRSESNIEVFQAVTKAWIEVFKRDNIAASDNFFDLGGDSLLIVHVHKKLEAALRKEISIVDLFKYPTINSLSRFLSGPLDIAQESEISDRARIRLSRRNVGRRAE